MSTILNYSELFQPLSSYPLKLAYLVDTAFEPSIVGSSSYSGIVLVNGLPASRTVSVFEAQHNKLITTLVSSHIDGSWTVFGLRSGLQILIVVKAQGGLERDAATIKTVT